MVGGGDPEEPRRRDAAHAARSLGPLADDVSPGSRCATGCASWTSSSRWPEAIWQRAGGCCRTSPTRSRHLPAGDPMRAYADRLRNPSLGEQVLRGYLSGSIDVVLRVGEPSARATWSSTTRPTAWANPGGRSPPSTTPRRWPPRRCCTPTTRCRRCSTRWCCTATCAGASPATCPGAPRRGALPLRPRHARRAHPGRRRHPVRDLLLAAAGGARGRALGPARRTPRPPPGGGAVIDRDPTSRHLALRAEPGCRAQPGGGARCCRRPRRHPARRPARRGLQRASGWRSLSPCAPSPARAPSCVDPASSCPPLRTIRRPGLPSTPSRGPSRSRGWRTYAGAR